MNLKELIDEALTKWVEPEMVEGCFTDRGKELSDAASAFMHSPPGVALLETVASHAWEMRQARRMTGSDRGWRAVYPKFQNFWAEFIKGMK